ncbi:hypothetical protein L3Q82_008921 [Scortum barcoo]|uniref:Uncharacterized protein n=1 Tax=Scortum barcoo TaxID=214431 RepID=A0ACB8XCP2_9TELE|nr:hypothetical protein L3Q82_008921 [Scortum barcoo]
MSFLRRVAGRSLRDRVRSSVTFGRSSEEVFQACPTGRRPQGKTQDTLERLCLSAGPGLEERLGVPPEELEEVSGVREVWASLLRLLPPRPGPGSSG